MRLLFYGLQNSGATLLTLLAGQRESSLVIPDLWTMHCAPEPPTEADMCLKATVTTSFALQEHVTAFRPDHVFLVVRRPTDNYASLLRKSYARHNGTPERKFAVADQAFSGRDSIDDVLVFEDVVQDPSILIDRLDELGWSLPPDATEFPRSAWDMEREIWKSAPELYERAQWGAGEARVQPLGSVRLARLRNVEAEEFSQRHAPALHEFYEGRSTAGVPEVLNPGLVQDEAELQMRANHVANAVRLVESSLRNDSLSEALSLASELTELEPQAPLAWDALARVHERMGNPAHAAEVLQRALDECSSGDQPRAELLTCMARHAARTGELGRAAQLAAAALSVRPRLVDALLVRAEVEFRRGDNDAARNAAERVLAVDPRHVRASIVLANSLAAAGDKSGAISILRACVAIAPDAEPVQRLLADYVSASTPEQSSPDPR